MDLLNCSKEESLNLLDLRKEKVELICNKYTVLDGLKSRAAVVFDVSGSMDDRFETGIMQATLERLFAIAVQFDDNGTMEVWIFNGEFKRLPDVTKDNFYGYVQREIISKGYVGGSTNYAPVMQDVVKRYMKEEPANLPNYIMFITDGDNNYSDKAPAKNEVILSSYTPIFWQFIGIGGSSGFEFLKSLDEDEMDGRNVDNANFFELNDIFNISDDILYERMLKEYPEWLKLDKVKEMIANPSMPSNITIPSSGKKKGLFKKLFG